MENRDIEKKNRKKNKTITMKYMQETARWRGSRSKGRKKRKRKTAARFLPPRNTS